MFFNNITFSERLGLTNYEFVNSASVDKVRIYNKHLNFQKVKMLYRDGKRIEPITLTLPTGKRNYIDHASKFYKHQIPGKKSQKINIDILKTLDNDYKGNYIPKVFATETYKIEPRDNAVDITGVEYLTKADSLGLVYNIIESEKRLIDWFTYTETISEYTDILLERLPKLIVRYSDVLNNKGQLQLPFQGQEEQEYRDKISMNMALCQDRLENLEGETWN